LDSSRLSYFNLADLPAILFTLTSFLSLEGEDEEPQSFQKAWQVRTEYKMIHIPIF
jgi:hypothetical protein